MFNSRKPVIHYFRVFRKNNINAFMIHSKTNSHNWFTYIISTNLSKMRPERILRIMMKWLINICQRMEMKSLVIIVIWYQFLYFSTQIHLKVRLWIMQLHRWVALMIFRMLFHMQKLWGKWYYYISFARFPMYHFPPNKYCSSNTYCWGNVEVILFKVRFQGY